jgi:hypothetical protein
MAPMIVTDSPVGLDALGFSALHATRLLIFSRM